VPQLQESFHPHLRLLYSNPLQNLQLSLRLCCRMVTKQFHSTYTCGHDPCLNSGLVPQLQESFHPHLRLLNPLHNLQLFFRLCRRIVTKQFHSTYTCGHDLCLNHVLVPQLQESFHPHLRLLILHNLLQPHSNHYFPLRLCRRIVTKQFHFVTKQFHSTYTRGHDLCLNRGKLPQLQESFHPHLRLPKSLQNLQLPLRLCRRIVTKQFHST